MARLDKTVDHVLVHTGQNYDHSLNQLFFDEMELRPPDHLLDVDISTLGNFLGGTLVGIERVLKDEQPDAVLILGDTNSSIAAVMAKRMHIPVYHMEAGNRCYDENVPEETNRRLVDHVADFNLVYTEHARRNLLAEGLHSRRIIMTGSPMREVLEHFRGKIDASTILHTLSLGVRKYFLVSVHREENVDIPQRLRKLMDCLEAVWDHYKHPIIVSTHPRTQARLTASSYAPLKGADIRFMKPFGFFDYNHLQAKAACVLSDSGTIAEEASIMHFPAVTLRDSIERPEALDSGSIIMADLDVDDLLQAVGVVTREGQARSLPAGYEVTDTSLRVVRFIASTAGRHRSWSGIRS
jgi:UDP-N-acetylglucosamine 2-epimerase (non-hydrolysing)